MELKKAFILCAGMGKRVMPLTKDNPKPLLQINNMRLVEYSLKLADSLGIKSIAINSHYLKENIHSFFEQKYPNVKIYYESELLDTGGCLVNAKSFFESEYLLVLNSDTIWQSDYLPSVKKLYNNIIENNFSAGLLLCKKNNSFDQTLSLDFDIKDNLLNKDKEFIYTGLQIIHSSIFQNLKLESFSIRDVWNKLILDKKITGEVYEGKFYHATNLEIFQKLQQEEIIY